MVTVPQGWVLAVDFGTSNTAAALRHDGGPVRTVRLSDQADQMPSAVYASPDGLVVGSEAVRSARRDPSAYEATPKRRIAEQDLLLGGLELSGTDLAAAVLTRVRQRVAQVTGGAVPREVRLTHPEQWSGLRQSALRDAAVAAGFDREVLRLVSEPVAAASRYAAAEPVPPGGHVAVFDFGGGTCDVAVLRAGSRAQERFAVVAAQGRDPLGGEDLDARLQSWVLDELERSGRQELAADLRAPAALESRLALRDEVRAAKHALSDYQSAQVPVRVGDRQAVVTVTAEEFDGLVEEEIDAAVALTRSCLQRAGLEPQDLHELYLTGGSSHLRVVHRRLTALLGRPPATLDDPKLVVALGALDVPDLGVAPLVAALPVAPAAAPTVVAPTVPLAPAASIVAPPPGDPFRAPGVTDRTRAFPDHAWDSRPTPGGAPGPAHGQGRRVALIAGAAALAVLALGGAALAAGAFDDDGERTAVGATPTPSEDPVATPDPPDETPPDETAADETPPDDTEPDSPSPDSPSPDSPSPGAEPPVSGSALSPDELALAQRLPPDYVDASSCESLSPGGRGLAAVTCTSSVLALTVTQAPPLVIQAASYPDAEALASDVQAVIDSNVLQPRSGPPGYRRWSLRDPDTGVDVETGDLLTFGLDGRARVVWSYEPDLLLIQAVGINDDVTNLNTWWFSSDLSAVLG